MGAVAVSVAVFAGVAMAWTPYVTYDLDRASNARTWANLEPAIAGSTTCMTCHEHQATAVAAAVHATVACESCHGALAGHAAEAAAPGALVATLEAPTDATCTRCHVDATGRPAGFATIDPWQHYKPACLECHDPHTAAAVRPPVVLHPLAKLPPCITCHGPEGFKARNIYHPDQGTDDVSCLECHAKGRGPEQDEQP